MLHECGAISESGVRRGRYKIAIFSALAQESLSVSIVNAKTGFIWNYFYQHERVIVIRAVLQLAQVMK